MATVHVSNISSQTTEKDVRDFFSFWYALLFLDHDIAKMIANSALQWKNHFSLNLPLFRGS